MLVTPQSSSGAPLPTWSGSGDDPWAIGYAVHVARSCPGWEVERQEMLAERGVLTKPDTGGALMPLDGPFQRDYYRGQGDAEKDHDRSTDFCERVSEVAGPKWPRLARVLKSANAR